MTSHPHTQARVQPRNTYNHTFIKFFCLDKTKQPHTKSRQNNLHSVHARPCRIYEQSGPKIHNKALPMATHPKVLGLTLDPKLTYSTHIHNISVKAHKPLQIIKALTATGWGKQKETLMATYKAVMRPALEYASSVWSPIASSTSINKLQVMQNTTLRTATGCTQDTNIQHLHDETLTLPIHEHLQLHYIHYTNTYHTSTLQDANNSYSLDHYAVLCYLNVRRPKTVHKSVKCRAFRKIPVQGYQNDVKVVLNNQSKTPDNINDLIDYYNSTLHNLTDNYAPLQCKKIALRPRSPWYTSALRREKRARRTAERVAARTQLEVDRQIVQNMYRRRN